MDNVPMKSSVLFSEAVTVRIDPELKLMINNLKNNDVDTAVLLRTAIKKAVLEAQASLDNKAS